MIITYVLLISCQQPITINESKDPWNVIDKQAIDKSIKTCLTDKEYIQTPCLSKFVKEAWGKHRFECGKEEKRE
jgi:hypothetical protein